MQNRICAVFVAMFIITSGLTGQTWDKRFSAGGHLNIFKFWGGGVNRSTISSMVGLNAQYGIRPNMQIGLEFGYGSFRPSLNGNIMPEDDALEYRTSVIPINFTWRATPLRNDIVKPYGLLGLGVLFWDLVNIDENSPSNGESVYGRQTDMTISAGVGVEWLFSKSWAVDFRAQNAFMLNQKRDNTGYGDDANSMMLEGRIGISYYFGVYVDTDGDGIQDKYDADPLVAEDFDGFQDHDGAPDLDNDNDGILDAQDGAPNSPEDIDNFQDQDGAPDPDNDGDGILDINDGAPNDPEDKDSFQDEDGVPDLDNDKDGINDSADACPNQPETVNEYLDEDGCPDEAPQTTVVPMQTENHIVLEGVNFELGSADLTSRAQDNLRTVANELLAFKQVKVRIVGHTDNTGTETVNRELSQRRADSVKRFLILNGISEDRLMTEGRGPSQPIADNATEEGRARNRRIEFERVE